MTVKREGSQTQVDAPERDEENEPTSALKMIETSDLSVPRSLSRERVCPKKSPAPPTSLPKER